MNQGGCVVERIVNYLDMSDDERNTVLDALIHIGFCPAYGKKKTMQREMDKSKHGSLSQYLFVLRGSELIGYMFLIGEREGISRAFPWWAVDNTNEVPLAIAVEMLQYGIAVCEKSGCCALADRLRTQLRNQKDGIGRRAEKNCR